MQCGSSELYRILPVSEYTTFDSS